MFKDNDEYLVDGASYARLLDEYERYGSLYIGFDFDNTVFDFHKKGSTYNKVIQLLKDLKSIGCKLICWTAAADESFPRRYMLENNIPFDDINKGGINLGFYSPKPMFSALLDDRAGLIQVYNDLLKLYNTVKSNENILSRG